MPMTPELDQLAFGNPWGDYSCPAWVDALVRELLAQIERVYANRHQRQWIQNEDPGIPDIEFRPYYWGNDVTLAALPNFKHGSIEVRWYKHPMRSSSLNVDPEPDEMIAWFESAMRAILAHDVHP